MNKNLIKQIENGDICIAGFPVEKNSSFLKGCAFGPDKIREAFNLDSTNKCSENCIDLGQEIRIKDIGDMKIIDFFNDIYSSVYDILDRGGRLLSLGGDHSITNPIVKAYGKKFPNLNIIHFDAHPDLYENFENNQFSHASPFARIMEDNLIGKLTQIGIRTMNPVQKKQSEKYDIEVIYAGEFESIRNLNINGPLYLSIDLDVLDPAFAPGVSHYEPGGLSTRTLLNAIQDIDAELVGADIVELNPLRDPTGMTAMVGAKLLKEILVKLLNYK